MARNPIKKAARALTSRYASKASEDARRAVGASEASQRSTRQGAALERQGGAYTRAGGMVRGTGRIQAEEAERHARNARRNARNARVASRFA